MLSDIQKNQAIVDTLIRLRDEFADETSKIEEEEAVHLSKLQSANLVSCNYQSNIFSQPSVQSESSTMISSSPDLQPELHPSIEEQGDVGSNQEEPSLPTSVTTSVNKRPAEEVIETPLTRVAYSAATASSFINQVSSLAKSAPSTGSPSSSKVKRFCHKLNRGPTGISKMCEAIPKSFGVKGSKPIVISCKRREPPVSSGSKDQSNQRSGRAASSSSSSVPLLLSSTSVTPLLPVKQEPKDDYEVTRKKKKPVVGKTSIDIIESPESTPVAIKNEKNEVKKNLDDAVTPRNSKSRKGTFKTSRARRGKLKR